MSKKAKRRFIKLRYVQRSDEDPDKILENLAEKFPKADLDIDLDRLPRSKVDVERDTQLEEKAVDEGNTTLDQREREYKAKKGLVQRFYSLRPFLQKLAESGAVTAVAEVVKTFFSKTP